jgi:hypothetical protein
MSSGDLMPDETKSEAYKQTISKIMEAFCPRILVVSSEAAKRSCHLNFLTPAEFLGPFCKERKEGQIYDKSLRWKKEEKYDEFSIRYSTVKFIDVEEWEPMDEKNLDFRFRGAAALGRPNCEALEKLNFSEGVDAKQLMSMYGWNTAVHMFGAYLKTIGKENEFSCLNDCMAVMYVISSDEKDADGKLRDLAEVVIELEKKHRATITAAFGGENTFSDRSFRLVTVLKDAQVSTEADLLGTTLITDSLRDTMKPYAINLQDLDERSKKIHNKFQKCHVKSFIINDLSNPENMNDIWSDGFVYVKKNIKAYETTSEKRDVNTPNIPRGRYNSEQNKNNFRSGLQDMVFTQLGIYFETQIKNTKEIVFEKKKALKKGLFDKMFSFNKDEKATLKDGKYVFTDIELEVKRFADMLVKLGMFAGAYYEYEYVLDKLGKKHVETSTSIVEMMGYCSVVAPQTLETKKAFLKLENNTMELMGRSTSLPYRYSRLLFLMNMLNHYRYDINEEPSLENQRAISIGASRFSVKHQTEMLNAVCPLLMQQFNRYNLLNFRKNFRVFFSLTINTSSVYLKKTPLVDYARAGFILACKFYDNPKMETWGGITEMSFYNLGVLYGQSGLEVNVPKMITAFSRVLNFNTLENNTVESAILKTLPTPPATSPSRKDIPAIDKKIDFVQKSYDHVKEIVTSKIQSSQVYQQSLLQNSSLNQSVGGSSTTTNEVDLLGGDTSNDDSAKFEKSELINTSTNLEKSSMGLTRLRNNVSLLMADAKLHDVMMKGLNTLKFGRHLLTTPEESPRDLVEEGELESSQGPALSKVEFDEVMKRHFDTLLRVVTLKLPQIGVDQIKSKIEYGVVPTLEGKLQHQNLRTIRDVSQGDKITYRIAITSQFYKDIQSELNYIELTFGYLEEIKPNERNPAFPANSIIPQERLHEYLSYTITPIILKKGETQDLEIIVTLNKIGYFKLLKIKCFLLESVLECTHDLLPYTTMPQNSYNVIRVSNDAGILEVAGHGLKTRISFGEIHKSLLCLKNRGSSAIEEIYIVSCEPLFTGFGFKPLGSLEVNGVKETELYIRGTQIKTSVVPLCFVYKSKGFWKYVMYHFEISVDRSLSTRHQSEDLQNGTRLVTIDILNGRDNINYNYKDLDISSVRVNSNAWRIVENSYSLIKNDKMAMITLKIEKMPSPNIDTYYLSRKHREYFPCPENKLEFENSIPYVDDFLKHENLEIARISPYNLCKDYLEISLQIHNSKTMANYLFSMLNIPTKSVAIVPNIKNEAGVVDMHKTSLKARFVLPGKPIRHDFVAEPLLVYPIKLLIDASGLPIDVEWISVRAFSCNERRPKGNERHKIEAKFENNTFNWTGKTKIKVVREPLFTEEETIGNSKVCKERDWSGFKKELEKVEGVVTFGIVDARTADIWMSKDDFKFEKYTDEAITKGSKEIDEGQILVQFFKTHGNLKTSIGIRLNNEKFFPKGYDSERHFTTFMNEKKTSFGAAGCSGSSILFCIWTKNPDQPISEADPENQVSTIFDRLADIEDNFNSMVFKENHMVEFKAVFPGPGSYELNHLAFYTDKDRPLTNFNDTEEFKIVIQDERNPFIPEEADLL